MLCSALRRKNVQLCAGDDSDDSEMDYEDDEEVYPEQQADVSRSFVRDGEDDEDYDYLDRTRDDDENMDESTEMPDW